MTTASTTNATATATGTATMARREGVRQGHRALRWDAGFVDVILGVTGKARGKNVGRGYSSTPTRRASLFAADL